ncbi:hypothetical protein GQ600_5777 [Phytophthora cactorum]|nr:hypothetical protein GQ600_5777 [Phytophthora cactorum]
MSFAGFKRLSSLVRHGLALDPLQSARRALDEPPVSPAGMLQTSVSAIPGCIGAIEGWLCPIRVARSKNVVVLQLLFLAIVNATVSIYKRVQIIDADSLR